MPAYSADELTELLSKLLQGDVSLSEAVERLSGSGLVAGAGGIDAQLDVDRRRRCGYPEVIFGPGKTPAALVEIFHKLQSHRQGCFATRVNSEQVDAVRQVFPGAVHNALARTLRLDAAEASPEDPVAAGRVVVITAGTSDRPVAEEAVETARWMGCDVELIVDVGVAGPHRLPAQLHRFEHAAAIVVVAGMEAALPSVVAGYVACPVIGVPTSIGYGANFQGFAALLGMINSCAANVTVVNIDAGFKGGYIAGMIARPRHRAMQ